MNKYFIGFIVVLVAAVSLIVFNSKSTDINISQRYGVDVVKVFKSPSCGCCDLYSAYLRKYGVDVEVNNIDDMDKIKDEYGVPESVASCHTSLFGNQIVEGHVPVEAVLSMLEDDKVSSIGMPGMPSGSPGMPGGKTGPFTIYSFDDSKVVEYMEI